MARLLSVLGAVFVLALVGGAIAGFAVLKDRVRIVVAADEVAAGPDPVALLRDDVQVVAGDLAALQQALGQNFEQLGTGLDERAAARHADVTAIRQQLGALQERLDRQQRAQAELQAAVQTLATAALATAAPANPGAPTSPAVPSAGQPDPAAAASAAAAAPPSPPPAVEPTAPAQGQPANAAPPKGAGFLSFAVPTTAFRFDQMQEYAVVPELSRVGFDAKSTLHDFTGVTSKVRGAFRADFDDAAGAWSGEIVVQAATMATGVEGRDTNMREHLATEQYPEIRFRLQRFVPAENGIDVAKQTARGEVVGTMQIRGQERLVRMPITIEVDPQKRVVVAGTMPLKLSDYAVPVPSQLGLINMQDEVAVWIALRARLQAGGKK